MVSKHELRKLAKESRLRIKDKEKKELIITKKILSHKKIKNSKNILLYVSKTDEVSTLNLINKLLELNKNIYVPRVVNKIIKFYKLNSLDELKLSSLGIFEPTCEIEYKNDNNSICIVPGLLFDKNNNRLGYGGGYYDKFLSENKMYKIGICFSDFLVEELITESHDIKMDEIITEV